MLKINFLKVWALVLICLLAGCKTESISETLNFSEVDSAYVAAARTNPKVRIVDARNNNWFIGWREEGVARGGHIVGATDFSADWLDIPGAQKKLNVAIQDKQLPTAQELIIYDSNGRNARRVAHYLSSQGLQNIKLYNVKDWASDSSKPMAYYPNFKLVVPPQFIKAILDGQQPETLSNRKVKFFEVTRGDESTYYLKGHIPGSVHIDTNEFESIPTWRIDSVDRVNTYLRLLNTDQQLLALAKKYGITADTTVILSSERQNATYRLAVILRYLGVKDVRVLNGGLDAYKRAGYPLETTSHRPEPIDDFGSKVPGQPQLIDDLARAKQILKSEDALLVDVRTKEEFLGKKSGYRDLTETGRPKGIVFHGGSKGETASDVFDYRNVDNTLRNRDEVAAMWLAAGIDPMKKHLAFMCGSGWRTAEVLTYAQVYGFDNTSMYSNGWVEWSHDPQNNPTER